MAVSKKLFKSSGLLFVGRFINRSIGLISTLILARILTPDDFGVVAIASVAVFFFDSMSKVGIREYLTQKQNLSGDDINTAWTLNALIKIVFWALFVCLIPLVSDFYGDERLAPVLMVVSSVLLFLGFESVGLILCQRELNYLPILKLQISEKITGFSIMLGLLIFIQSYWVMIISLVSTYVLRFIGSYIVAPYAPSLSIRNIRHQWAFSKWLLPKGAIGFLKSELDTILVSKLFGLASLGGFNLVKSLVSMIGRDILQPATDPLLAAFSKTKGDTDNLKFQAELSLWVISLLILPIVGYTYCFSDVVVLVLYGDNWLAYSNVLAALTPLIYIFATSGVLINLLTSQAKVKGMLIIEVASMLFMAAALISFTFASLEQFSYVRTAVSTLFWVVLLLYSWTAIGFSLKELVGLLSPGFLSMLLSAYLSSFVQLIDLRPLMELLLSGVIFVLFYLALVAALSLPLKRRPHVVYIIWLAKSTLRFNSNKVS